MAQRFQRLAEGVAQGRVGAVLALEVSRLTRSSADWHRLLELCGLADVVIVDEQAVYTPLDYNDRLLLGLKGQMSEAEQYWMRLHMEGGRLNKARRGRALLSSAERLRVGCGTVALPVRLRRARPARRAPGV